MDRTNLRSSLRLYPAPHTLNIYPHAYKHTRRTRTSLRRVWAYDRLRVCVERRVVAITSGRTAEGRAVRSVCRCVSAPALSACRACV